ncbi:MAG: hypothetical protein PHQ59_02455 [Candidatus Daviesbacteria bacterium]|nr:hypothetical protein [Candidatus Daviesbacteria bacterium]
MESAAETPVKYLKTENINKIFLAVLVSSIILGIISGYFLSTSNRTSTQALSTGSTNTPAKAASQDTRTFRDFAEGVIQKQPAPKNPNDYVEGTHLLVRIGGTPVALTSSVVDLSQYEGKKVKVFGETQKAMKEGWLMDVGKVELQ